MKYKIGDLLEIKYDSAINITIITNNLANYKSEYAKEGQLFLIIDCGPIGYTLFSQESGNNSAWGEMSLNYRFKKVL